MTSTSGLRGGDDRRAMAELTPTTTCRTWRVRAAALGRGGRRFSGTGSDAWAQAGRPDPPPSGRGEAGSAAARPRGGRIQPGPCSRLPPLRFIFFFAHVVADDAHVLICVNDV
ncbi:Os12g0553800 [Oryza sativa Japonica Group]|uniref:Os12g0553800 protein n=1 Tax=Oryza sativa subsp. japonica TaxID=39947 RepID=A0A0P0YBC9_ORYSJ|nr:hypothetical protein EE612_060175 [Oryza sativa]BAT17589.1 Os12g0553800 [Oryza sativa Japonica Group]